MKAQKDQLADTIEILIVEDSATQAEQLRYLLEQHHYKVHVADSGKKALALLGEHKPSLVISDIIMPEMSGYELCKRIKSDNGNLNIPVILLTSLSNSEDVLEGLACGADNFITKPYSEEYLLLHIEQILVNKKLHKNERVCVGVEIMFAGKRRFITADHQQMLSLLISTYEAAVRKNVELVQTQNELRSLNERLEELVEERTAALKTEIRAHQRTEEALRESEEWLKDIIYSVGDWVWAVDENGRYTYTSRVGQDLFGSAPEDVIGKTPFDFMPPDEAERVKAIFSKIVSTKAPIKELENWNIRKDGERICLLTNGVPILDKNGNLRGYRGVDKDITERKRAQEILASQHALLTALINSSHDIIIFSLDKNYCYTTFNEKHREEMKRVWNADIRIGTNLLDCMQIPELRTLAKQSIDRALLGEVFSEIQHQFNLNIYYEFSWNPIYQNEEIVGVTVFIRDITERKRAEEALLASEARYRSYIDATGQIGWVTNADGEVVEDVPSLRKFSGQTYEEAKGSGWVKALHPDDLERTLQAWNKAVTTKSFYEIEYRMRRHDGVYRYLLARGFPVFREDGSIREWVGTCIDITERNRTEEALKQSEAKYQDLYNNAPTMLASVDHTTGKVVECNSTVLKRTGFERSEVIGSHILERYHPDCIEKATAAFDKFIEYGEVKNAELELSTVLGGKIPVLLNVSSVRDEAGMILYSRSVWQDITELRRAEEKIRQSEERYRAVADSAVDSIITVDEAGIIIGWNQGATRTFGYNEKEILGCTMDMLMPESYRDAHKNGFNRFQEGGQPRVIGKTVELEGKRKDGSVFPLELSLAEWETIEGRFFSGMIRDITERKLLQRQFIEGQKMESLGTLAGGIAHDFNNILGIVLGQSALLERTRENEAQFKEGISSINKAVQRGASLVRQILTFARKAETELQPVSINSTIKELAKMLEETFSKTTVVALQLDKTIPLISMDPAQLHQALLNLCINARDAMEGKGTLTIATHLVHGRDVSSRFPKAKAIHYAQVSVSDTGTGIDEETRQRIFEPFFTTKEKGKGTGLGLAVVYGVLQAHNGFVDVETAPGHGTTFHLFFPVPEGILATSEEQKGTGENLPRGTETILVVEDEDVLRDLLVKLLEMQGYKVIPACDGDEAVKLFAEHADEIGLVLSDMGLPKANGWDAFKMMQKVDPNVRALLASGYIEPGQKSEVLKSGVRRFISKPYRMHEVLKAVRETLDEKK